ncbi:MAG: DUF4115 domain-containing protein [Armatimonadetes bacterium]|nr:DUF4115 domain-containing protein [Armatimonadota bacterium]
MENASIGEILRAKRESRGLGLEEVHEETKITVQNLAALEENRFDAFPNKVYARAFLRDYANFLDLDSASLLARYEDQWGCAREAEALRAVGRSARRAVWYAVVVILLLGGVGVGSYIWWIGCEQEKPVPPISDTQRTSVAADRKAVSSQPIPHITDKPKPSLEKQGAAAVSSPIPDKITLEVTAIRPVWVRVKCDGMRVYEAIMPTRASKSFEARDSINIRAGMAGAVRIKLNGVPQKPLKGGTLKQPGEKTYRRQDSVPASALPGKPSSF